MAVDLKQTTVNPVVIVPETAFNAAHAKVWAEGTDEQVEELGGVHSAKGWATDGKNYTDAEIASHNESNTAHLDIRTTANSAMPKAGGTFTGNVTIASGKKIVFPHYEIGENSAQNAIIGDGNGNGLVVLPNGQGAALFSSNGSSYTELIAAKDVKSTYSSTGLDPVNGTAVASAISGKQDALPSGTAGQYLQKTADGVQWSTVSGTLPTQTGQSGKFLTTDGTDASWATADALPSQTSQSGKFLTTNGTTASWDNIPTELPSQTGNSGKFLTTNGTSASWASVQAGGPSFTWFSNQSSASIDTEIDNLESKSVMVFKNGLLLEKGVKIPGDIWFEGGSGKNVTLSSIPTDFSTADSWEIRTVYKHETSPTQYPTVFGSSGSILHAPAMHLEGGNMVVYITSNGSTRIVNGVSIGLSNLQAGTQYYLVLAYNATGDDAGYVSYYSTSGFDYTNKKVLSTSTTKAFCDCQFMFLNQQASSAYYTNGSFNLTKTKITTNGVVRFDGETATAADYTNNGCEQVGGITNDYGIDGSIITFKTGLVSTDKIAVGVF